MENQITFENHRFTVQAGSYSSIEKILAVEENYYGPIEVIKRNETTCTYRFKTEAGFLAKCKKAEPATANDALDDDLPF